VVAPAGGGHRLVLSTVRRGPPPPVWICGRYPGLQVASALLLRGWETWGECRAGRGSGRRRQGARIAGWLARVAAAAWWGSSGGRGGRVKRVRGGSGVGGWVWASGVVGSAAEVGLEGGLRMPVSTFVQWRASARLCSQLALWAVNASTIKTACSAYNSRGKPHKCTNTHSKVPGCGSLPSIDPFWPSLGLFGAARPWERACQLLWNRPSQQRVGCTQ